EAKVRWHREHPSRPHSQGIAASAGVLMISRTLAADLAGMAGKQATIAGWLHRKRQLKSMTFLIIRDRTGLAQAVLTEPQASAAAAVLLEQPVLEVTGKVTDAAQAPGGAEITIPVITAMSGPAA